MTKIEEKAEYYAKFKHGEESLDKEDLFHIDFIETQKDYLQGAKDMKDIILDKLEIAFESMPKFKEVKRETVRGCIDLVKNDIECRINDEL